jgi:methylated-DNA-protein-cysteine methyltransferase related protein
MQPPFGSRSRTSSSGKGTKAGAARAGPSATERILALVARIPPGRVMTYGDIADVLGLGSPRQVGRVLAGADVDIPWHRVLRSDGTMAEPVRDRQRQLLLSEGVGMVGERVDLEAHQWSGAMPNRPHAP